MKYRINTNLDLNNKEFKTKSELLFALRAARVLAQNNDGGLLIIQEDGDKSRPVARTWLDDDTHLWSYQMFGATDPKIEKELKSFCSAKCAANETTPPTDNGPEIA